MIECFYMEGLPVAVMGLGKSGLAAAKALAASKAEVWAWDDDPKKRAEAEAQGVKLVDLRSCDWSQLTTLVLSPGIPHTHPVPHPVAAAAKAAGVEIVGDIELLARAQREAGYIGVTGTNGKSTTTALIGHLLRMAGREVQVGGNLGMPALSLDPLEEGDFFVLEMSSYQIELTVSLTFDIAVLLNITPDHLDRHGGMAGYVAAKKRIFHRQTKPRAAVIGVDDDHCRRIHADLERAGDQRVFPISSEIAVRGGVYATDGMLIDDIDGAAVAALDLREVPTLPGRHNWQNAAAAYAAVRAAGVAAPVVAQCMRSYPGLKHRQEQVAASGGIRFVNDSKATNPEAAAKALASYANIYWIAGGKPKEGGLDALYPHLKNVRRAFLIGEASARFARALDGRVALEQCGELKKALASALAAAQRDGAKDAVVLLSPACASFDQFANFEARGDEFRRLVAELTAPRRSGERVQ
jgi:UDP-N-acetylmuramoylalanine--D-glutamate ligase